MNCKATDPGSVCLYHYQFIVAPGWFEAISWLAIGAVVLLATVWVCQRARARR